MGELADDLRRVLEDWVPPGGQDAEQESLRERYLAHLDEDADAVWRDGPPEHFTASCLVLDATLTSVLLTLHAKARRWFQLGGHLEPGDRSVAGGALREALEESGADAESLRLLARPVQLHRHSLPEAFGWCREHLDLRYVAVASPGAAIAMSEESLDLAWWPVEALPPESSEELGPLVTAALEAVAAETASGPQVDRPGHSAPSS